MKKYTKPELTIASFEASDSIALTEASGILGTTGHDFQHISFGVNFS